MRLTHRTLGQRALAATAIATLAATTFAGTAHAATTATTPGRDTVARTVGLLFAQTADQEPGSPRKVSSLRSSIDFVNDYYAEDVNAPLPVTVSGIRDANKDGMDDDGRVTVTVFANRAIVDFTKRGPVVRDGGFIFKDRRAVLKESALNLDAELRWAHRAFGSDTWDMDLINWFANDVAPAVTLTSDYDGNGDLLDDDGRLTLLANGKAVTLTIGNTPKEKGKVTYGPTWRTAAPKRNHHRADAALLRSAEHASAQAAVSQFSHILQAASATQGKSARTISLLREAINSAPHNGAPGLTFSGVVDANKDGIDDDAKVTISMNHGNDVFVLTLPREAGDAATYKSIKG